MIKKKKDKFYPKKTSASKNITHQTKIFFAILALSLILNVLQFDPKPFLGGDNATYIILTKSILSGKGFRDISSPGEPAHIFYPFGYPLLLTWLIALFPNTVIPLKFFTLLLSLLSLFIFYIFLKELDSKFIYFLFLLIILNPNFIEYSHWELSEIPYLFFSLLSLYLLKIDNKGESVNITKIILSSLSIAMTYYIRTAGVSLIIAVIFYGLLRRNYKKTLLMALFIFLFLVPWSIRNYLAGGTGYFKLFLMNDPYNIQSGTIDLTQFIERIIQNIEIYALKIFPTMFISQQELISLLWIPSLSLITIGFIMSLTKHLELKDLYFLFHLIIAMLWPTVWSDRRFLIPVLPFLLFYLLSGFNILSIWLRFSPIKWLGITLLILLNIHSSVLQIPKSLSEINDYRKGDIYSGYPPNWINFFKVAVWCKENTSKSSVIVSRKPTLFFLFSERKSFCYPFTPQKDSVLSSIRKADYVVVDVLSATTERYLTPALANNIPNEFQILYKTEYPETYLLKVIK